MDRCELSVAGLREVRWSEEVEIVQGNYTMV